MEARVPEGRAMGSSPKADEVKVGSRPIAGLTAAQ